MDFQKGDHLALSSIQTTVHLGAHVDASNHYSPQGQGIEKKDLSIYLGLAQVVQVPLKKSARIFPSDFAADFKVQAPRILLKTLSYPDPENWNGDFMSLSPELIESFAQEGVVLVGIDTPSVDPSDSKKLESHQIIFEKKMSIIEGILLDDVPEGLYTLIALPLRMQDLDASPVRAILLPKEFSRLKPD